MTELVVKQQFIRFMGFPLAFFLCEIIIKLITLTRKYKIRSIKYLGTRIVELIVDKPILAFKAGQYVRINIPEISRIQWHPFTIVSSPDQDELKFYISPVGYWTAKLEQISKKFHYEIVYECKLEEKKGKNRISQESTNAQSATNINEVMEYPYCRIDGPLGAPAQNYTGYKRLILIAAGIGATPFASILSDYLHKIKNGNNNIEAVDFYWVIRSYIATSWLIDLFKEIMKYDTEKKINFNLMFTCSQQKYDFRSFFLWHGLELLKREQPDKVSEYCGNIYWGRPNWNLMFYAKALELNNYKGKVGVFICANNEVMNDVFKACRHYSGNGLIFDFHKENF
jgi:predicted ferric reductase